MDNPQVTLVYQVEDLRLPDAQNSARFLQGHDGTVCGLPRFHGRQSSIDILVRGWLGHGFLFPRGEGPL